MRPLGILLALLLLAPAVAAEDGCASTDDLSVCWSDEGEVVAGTDDHMVETYVAAREGAGDGSYEVERTGARAGPGGSEDALVDAHVADYRFVSGDDVVVEVREARATVGGSSAGAGLQRTTWDEDASRCEVFARDVRHDVPCDAWIA